MKELGIRSVIMRKKPAYKKGLQHKLFENLLKRNFTSKAPNQRWCADFTYLTLSTGENAIIVVFLTCMIDVLEHL